MSVFEIVEYPKIEGFNIFFTSIEYRAAHFNEAWALIWILDQPTIATCGTESFRVEPGQILFFAPNEPREFQKINKGCVHLCMQISPKILPAMPRVQVKEHTLHDYLNQEELRELKQDFIKMIESYLLCKPNYELYCIGQSHMILWKLLSKVPVKEISAAEATVVDRRNARLRRLITFVKENHMNKIRLADFAQQENCSLSYMSRFVKESLDRSFQEYVTSVRFDCACKLILEGNKKMLDVCMESGFSDYRYFSREFQKRYGMTPEKYSSFLRKRKLEKPIPDPSHRSIERYCSKEESLELIKKYRETIMNITNP